MNLNPFGAAKKLRAETKIREQAEHDRDGAVADVSLKREEIESLKTQKEVSAEVSATATRAMVDAAKRQTIRIEGLEQELAEAPHRAMEELVAQRGVRIGYRDFDLINIQAAARAVDSSIRIERENFRWVFYADGLLEQPQMRRLESKIGFGLERG